MTSSTQIEKYLKNHSEFLGCFGTNNLPKALPQFPCSLIVNTDPTTKPGDHWLGLVLTKNKCFFFDSFGLGIMDLNIKIFLKQYYKKVSINNHCIQHLNSDKCGLYCIAFIKHVNSTMTYEKFISKFNLYNLLGNDNVVLSLL